MSIIVMLILMLSLTLLGNIHKRLRKMIKGKTMSDVIKGVRFLLETVTVLGLVGGLSTKKSWAKKLVFALLGLVVTLIWSRYGAPRSPYALTGLANWA